MLKFSNVLRGGIFWAVLVSNITAGIIPENGVHPRLQNVSDLLFPAPSSSLLPQAPAAYCGKCIIEAPGGIRLVYWKPDDVGVQADITANPNQPYTIVENGFTYTSPSVYVIYSELQATVSATGACDLAASGDPVGPSFAAKTIGYSSRFLAYGTVTFPDQGCTEQVVVDGYHTIDFSQLYHTPIVETTTTKEGCAPYANPRLSLPAELTNVDPAWKTCEPLFYGAFDPPSVLTKASRLAPAQADHAAITPTPPPVPALPPAAKATPAAQTPAATTTPNGQKPGPDALDQPTHLALDPTPELSSHAAAYGNDGPSSLVIPLAVTADPPAPANGNDKPSSQVIPNVAAATVDPPAQSPSPEKEPDSQKAPGGKKDPSGQVNSSAAAIMANPPAQSPAPETDSKSQKAAAISGDPGSQVAGPGAAVIVKSPVQSPASAANIVVAQGTTLTENGPPTSIGGKAAVYSSGSIYVYFTPVEVPTNARVSPAKAVVGQGQTLTEGGPSATVGGKAAVYSAGSIYLDSSTPVAVPKAENKNVVVAQGQTLTENGPTASIGGKPAMYSAGSVYYDSTPIAIPKASPTNIVVAQGQTLSEGGPPAVIGGKTAMYKAGSVYYDSKPVAVPTLALGQQNPRPVVAAGVTFAPTVQDPSPVVTNGITFAPAVEKASPIVAHGITFAPIPQPSSGDAREPVVAGSITFQPSHVRSSNPVALETPAPLSVGSNPVLKAANGGLISQGSTISLLGHMIAADSDNVVVDGTTHSLASVTAHPVGAPIATPLEIANTPVLKAANGDLVIAGSTVSQGSTTSLLGHAVSVGSDNVIVDGIIHAFGSVTAHPLQTPAPLEIANQPVVKAANGGLVIAGITIPQGSQTSLFGHVISVGAGDVVDDGKTLAFAANTEAARHQSVTSLLYGSFDIVMTLSPGATYSSRGQINTYTGSTPSVLTEAALSVIGTATVPLQASALPSQIWIEASVSATAEQLFVQPSASDVEYVMDGKTATAAAPSDVPIGGLILAGLGRNGSARTRASVLPSIVMVNGTVPSTTTSPVGSPPSLTSQSGSSASPSGPHRGRGSRVIVGCGLWVWGMTFWCLGVALIAYY